jgi:amino acid adenylation domain-containing protein
VSEAVELLDSLAKQGVVLWSEGSRLRYRASNGKLTPEVRSQLASQKDAVLYAWCERAAQTIVSYQATHAQRASWFLQQQKPESGIYNIVFSARVRSAIEMGALRRSFQALVDRHPSLRTTFSDEADGLIQRIQGWMPVRFTAHDRSGIELSRLREEIYQASQAPFDLRTGPLMRVDLFTRSADDHVLLATIHHIAADGWSMSLLLDDLRRLYPAECNGVAAYPPRPTCDILQHARWQSAMLAGPEREGHEAYWLSQLADVPSPLSMPTDRPRSVAFSQNGASLPIDLGIDLSDAVRALAAREGVTPFMVLLTAYQVLLHRYTGQQEVIVGSPVYGRDRQEFADVVGLFINMLPLRATFNDDPSLREVLARVRQAIVEGIQHQDYPFTLIVEKLRPNRDISRNPVFQTAFNLQKYPQVGGLEAFLGYAGSEERAEFGGLVLEPFPVPQQEGQLELSVELTEKDGAYQGVMKYDPGLFDALTMRRFLSHYAMLLRSIVASPESKVSELPLLERTEREWLVTELNPPDREYPRKRTVVDLVREQAARRPEAKAVNFESETLTYSELEIRSTRLARHIRSLRVGGESLVGLCLERGMDLVVGILAVLKAGAAYVPLDPAFPAERLGYMVEDSGAKILITHSALSERLFSGLDLECVCLDRDQTQIDQQSSEPLAPLAGPSHRAYVLYTSGSTGRPKGVEIEHRSLTNFLCSMAREPGLSENDVLLAVTTLGFDIAGLELLLPLITGARIELASRETAMDGAALARALTDSGATAMQATPATWRMLFDSDWRGDRRLKVLCGGEAMDRELAARLVSTCGSVWNMYGPTETTIWSSLDRIESDEVTIGRPIANTRMYVLDNHREPAPRGVVGELWIGGDGVARGYLNRPELTAERFVGDPFRPGERMYRTGDLARYLSDGRLECLGRIDNQVKTRGYRIELGEIETVLHSHPEVQGCVVDARSETGTDARLIAYVVAGTAKRPSTKELRTYLERLLPDYMIPSGFLFLDAIPLTPNRKVDRNALPIPENSLPEQKASYVAPRNQVEATLAEIWADVLGLGKVGVFDHFFELGGHSLSATRLASRVRAVFGVELSIGKVFDSPRLMDLAGFVEEAQRTTQVVRGIQIVRPRPARIPLSPAQLGFWFLYRLEGASANFNMAAALRLKGGLDEPALEAALKDIVGRHEILRTIFPEEEGVAYQRVLSLEEAGSILRVEETEEEKLPERLAEAAATGLDLSCEIPFRVLVFRLASQEHVMLFLLHHIAGDAWSGLPFFRDFSLAYEARCRGQAPDLKPLHVQYADYTLWQRKQLGEDSDPASRLGQQLQFWRKALAGAPQELNLPADYSRPAVPSYRGRRVVMRINAELHRKLTDLAQTHGVSLFMIFQASLAALLTRMGTGEDIPIGVVVAGRKDPMLEDLVGVFINVLVMRTDVSGDPSFVELLGRTRKFDLEAYAHQDLPFQRLVEALNPERSPGRHPLFQVALVLRNMPTSDLKFPGLKVTAEPLHPTIAALDLALELDERVGSAGEPLGLDGGLCYRLDRFDHGTVEKLAAHLIRFLESAVARPHEPLHRLNILSPDERQQLLESFSGVQLNVPEQTIVQLFESLVVRSPQARALGFGKESMSYAELSARSNRLARLLVARGVGEESLVGLCLERGMDLVVSILAILKAGAAYVPLDPAFPAERLRYMVKDSGAKVLISQRKLKERLFSGLDLEWVQLDEAQSQIDQQSSESLAPMAGPSNRAYVLYTSGSTGRPKGVEIEHRALTNFLGSMAREPGLTQNDVLLAVTTLGFDIAGLELFLPLITGARIELVSRETAMDGAALARALTDSGATLMQATPATWRMLFDSGWKGDRRLKVLCGGEAMDRELAARLVSTCGSVWNMYGPTETTIWSSVAQIESDEVTIGRPIANTRMYVLDNHRELVPRGVMGELWIGGDGVARGYLNRPELTDERFVADPFRPGERMYRTGDLARHLSDGRLECLGRIDNQVKIRGYRIELGEIETVLQSHPHVQGCAVAARTDNGSDARLIAYIVPVTAEPPSIEELRTYLQGLLPDYMIPSGFVFLDAIPLTPNGKLDRNALPTPENNLPEQKADYVAPRNEVEERMAEIWADVLGVKQVGVFDHFFELGGHSLSATRLLARLKGAFETDLPLRSLFIDPTIAGLSKHIVYDASTQRYRYLDEIPRFKSLVPVQPKGSQIPLFLVAGFWDAEDTMRTLSGFIPHLGLDQPLYGFQPRWVDDNSQRYSGVEEAAAEFLTELLSVQPKGPYQLGGDCVGGVIALVMAEELLRRGEQIQLLVLLDTHKPSLLRALAIYLSNAWRYHVRPRTKHIINVLSRLVSAPRDERAQLVRDLAHRKIAGDKAKRTDELEYERLHRLRMDYIRTMYRHRLKNYPGKITLIVNEKHYKFDKSLGWIGIAAEGIDIHATPGDHFTRFHHGKEFAQRLANCLVKAQTEMCSTIC